MKRESFDDELKRRDFRVTLFGSARVTKSDPTYRLVRDLAHDISKQGMDLVTGGGPGLMEAANAGYRKGHKSAGHAVGLLINLPHEKKSGASLDVSRVFSRFSERLDHFMTLSNAIVIAPGGLGTLLELFYSWQLIQVKQTCDIPLILLGDHYKSLIEWVKRGPLRKKYLNPEDMHSIFFAKDAKAAMHILNEAYAHFKQGGKNICLNMQKYKV